MISNRERFSIVLTDFLVLLWVWWQTNELDVAAIGLLVQLVGFLVYRVFPEKESTNATDVPS